MKIIILNFKVKFKVKVKEFKVQNLIIAILGKDKTCLKFWTTLQQNYDFDLEGQGQSQGVKVQNLIVSILGKDETSSEILNDIAAKPWAVGCSQINRQTVPKT